MLKESRKEETCILSCKIPGLFQLLLNKIIASVILKRETF